MHAAKARRSGVPVLTGHTITRALGENQVCGAEIAEVDADFEVIEDTKTIVDVDTVCIAAGLRPYANLAALAGCTLSYVPDLGGWVPLHDEEMETGVRGIYIAGDLAGVEEAGVAMEEGRVAGLAIARRFNPAAHQTVSSRMETAWQRLNRLRAGPFGYSKQRAKQAIANEWRQLQEHKSYTQNERSNLIG